MHPLPCVVRELDSGQLEFRLVESSRGRLDLGPRTEGRSGMVLGFLVDDEEATRRVDSQTTWSHIVVLVCFVQGVGTHM